MEYSFPIQTQKFLRSKNKAPTSERSKGRKMKKENHLYQILSPADDLLREETRGFRRQNRNQSKLKKFWQEHISTVPAKIGLIEV